MVSSIRTRPYDSAEFLDTDEAVAAYIDEVLATNDAALIAHAVGVVARARGMSEVARETGLAREALYKALSAEGNPEFATVLKVLKALRVSLSASPATVPAE